jgi:hypothetical protein
MDGRGDDNAENRQCGVTSSKPRAIPEATIKPPALDGAFSPLTCPMAEKVIGRFFV